jgi:acyl carrier protein
MLMITRDEVLNVVKKHLMDNVEDLEESKIDPARSMKDMGANSLDIVEVVSCSMRELKIKVPRAELAQLTNMDGLVDLLYSHAMQKQVAATA